LNRAGRKSRPGFILKGIETMQKLLTEQVELGIENTEAEAIGQGDEDQEMKLEEQEIDVEGEEPTKRKRAPARPESDMESGIRLTRILDKVMGIEGLSASEIFRDFLEITELTLLRLGDQFNALARTGAFEAEDPPEIAARWKAVAGRYRSPQKVFALFAEGFSFLLEKSGDEDGTLTYADVVGCAYMQFLSMRDQSFKGQFFTPSPVARMMAEMTMIGVEQEVLKRLREAIEKSPLAQAMGLALDLLKDVEGGQDGVWKYLLPLIRSEYQPVTILDPCVGSGILLLAAAASIPRQYTDLGLVAYYGMDIDPICAQMTRINSMIYGLNGWSYRLTTQKEEPVRMPSQGGVWEAEEAPEPVIAALPEPIQTLYREVRSDPNPERKKQARKKIIEGQLAMFGMDTEGINSE